MITARADRNFSSAVKLKFLKYREIFKINYYDNTVYVSEMIGYCALVAFRIWLLTELYTKVFASRGITAINGLNLTSTIWILGIISTFQTGSRVKMQVKQLGLLIKTGDIAYAINKPYSFIFFNSSGQLGFVLSNVALSIFISVAVILALIGPIHVNVANVLLGAAMVFLGLLLNIFICFILGVTAFWTEDTYASRWIYDKIVFVTGGSFFPLAFFPDLIRKILEYLPFSNIFYTPVHLIFAPNLDGAWKILAIQLGWILAAFFFGLWLFKRGVKNISINGG